jgi:hypothetical protein
MGNMLKTLDFIDDSKWGRHFTGTPRSMVFKRRQRRPKKLAACHELPRRITIRPSICPAPEMAFQKLL